MKRGTKIVTEIKFEKVWDELESKIAIQRQSVTNIWDKLYFSHEITPLGKSLISIFQNFFSLD